MQIHMHPYPSLDGVPYMPHSHHLMHIKCLHDLHDSTFIPTLTQNRTILGKDEICQQFHATNNPLMDFFTRLLTNCIIKTKCCVR